MSETLDKSVVKYPHNQGLTAGLNKYTIEAWLGSFVVEKTILFKSTNSG
jgi:hypothetical protein